MVMTLLTRPKKSVATVVVASDGSGDFNTDGTADDVEIQAAVDSLPATGGCMYIKEGVYYLDNAIVINGPNITIKGCGRSTQITTNNAIILFDVSPLIAFINFTMEDIYLNGNNLATYGLYLDGSGYGSTIRGIWVEYCNDGVYCSVNGTTFINNFLSHNIRYGIEITGWGNNILSSNYIGTSGTYGIYVNSTSILNIISSNTLGQNPTGIYVNNGSGGMQIITGNVFMANANYGLDLEDDKNIVTSNYFANNDLLINSDYNEVNGNHFISGAGFLSQIIDNGSWNQIFNNFDHLS